MSYASAERVLRGGGSLVLVTNAPVSGGTEDVMLELDAANPWRPPSAGDVEQRRALLRATAAVVDEQLGGEVAKQYVAVCASARRITRV